MALLNVNWARIETYEWDGEVEVPDEVYKQGRGVIKAWIIENCLDDVRDYGFSEGENRIVFERIDEDES